MSAFEYQYLQETRMLSQTLNRVIPHSRNQLEEGVNRKELTFYLAVHCLGARRVEKFRDVTPTIVAKL